MFYFVVGDPFRSAAPYTLPAVLRTTSNSVEISIAPDHDQALLACARGARERARRDE